MLLPPPPLVWHPPPWVTSRIQHSPCPLFAPVPTPTHCILSLPLHLPLSASLPFSSSHHRCAFAPFVLSRARRPNPISSTLPLFFLFPTRFPRLSRIRLFKPLPHSYSLCIPPALHISLGRDAVLYSSLLFIYLSISCIWESVGECFSSPSLHVFSYVLDSFLISSGHTVLHSSPLLTHPSPLFSLSPSPSLYLSLPLLVLGVQPPPSPLLTSSERNHWKWYAISTRASRTVCECVCVRTHVTKQDRVCVLAAQVCVHVCVLSALMYFPCSVIIWWRVRRGLVVCVCSSYHQLFLCVRVCVYMFRSIFEV